MSIVLRHLSDLCNDDYDVLDENPEEFEGFEILNNNTKSGDNILDLLMADGRFQHEFIPGEFWSEYL